MSVLPNLYFGRRLTDKEARRPFVSLAPSSIWRSSSPRFASCASAVTVRCPFSTRPPPTAEQLQTARCTLDCGVAAPRPRVRPLCGWATVAAARSRRICCTARCARQRKRSRGCGCCDPASSYIRNRSPGCGPSSGADAARNTAQHLAAPPPDADIRVLSTTGRARRPAACGCEEALFMYKFVPAAAGAAGRCCAAGRRPAQGRADRSWQESGWRKSANSADWQLEIAVKR